MDDPDSADRYVSALREHVISLVAQIESISESWPTAARQSIPSSVRLLLNSRVLHWKAVALNRIDAQAADCAHSQSFGPNENSNLTARRGDEEHQAGAKGETPSKTTPERVALNEYRDRVLAEHGREKLRELYNEETVTDVALYQHLRIDRSRYYKALRHEIPGSREAKDLLNFLGSDTLPKPTWSAGQRITKERKTSA